jgi:hypothetical protein
MAFGQEGREDAHPEREEEDAETRLACERGARNPLVVTLHDDL